jgi:hypothetical protein
MTMHWIARCPACGATYQVVPDQIKIAQGWLRCGQCEHDFDSTGLLVHWPSTEQNALVDTEVSPTGERVVIDELLRHEDRPISGTADSAVSSFEKALSTFKPITQPPPAVSALETAQPDGLAALPQPALQAKTRDGLLRGVVLLLTLALALQWLWLERQTLSLQAPWVVHGLQQFCGAVGCETEPLQVRGGVVIESSNWAPQDGGFVLSWSVRNVTARILEMPALELTLLDAQGHAVLRRVFMAAECNAPSVLAPGQTDQGQLLTLLDAELPHTGYRLATFYP